MITNIPRHRVFISYHDEDREHKERFVRNMGDSIIDCSVQVDDIDDTNIQVDTIRRYIRDDYIADATVTIVLVGPCTWQRKHVDWEIGSSLRGYKEQFQMWPAWDFVAAPPGSWQRDIQVATGATEIGRQLRRGRPIRQGI